MQGADVVEVDARSCSPGRKQDEATLLIARAESVLQSHEWKDVQAKHNGKKSRDEAAHDLEHAINEAQRTDSSDNKRNLASALDTAGRARVPPQLCNRARRLLLRSERNQHQVDVASSELQRLMSQLADMESGADDAHRTKRELLQNTLRNTIHRATRIGVDEPTLSTARAVAAGLLPAEDSTSFKTQQLQKILLLEDPAEMQDKFNAFCKHSNKVQGRAFTQLMEKVQTKIAHLQRRLRERLWLEAELELAASVRDSARIAQLIDQSKALDLPVPPAMHAVLDSLEDAHNKPLRIKPSEKPLSHCHTERLHKCVDAAKSQLDEVERSPSLRGIELSRRAVESVKRCRGGSETWAELDSRLAALEKAQGSRLHKEEHLLAHFKAVEPHVQNGLPVPDSMVQELQFALREAQKFGLNSRVLDEGYVLLQKCQASQAYDTLKHSAEEELRQALAAMKGPERDRDTKRLKDAIDACKNCSLCTLHADKVYQQLSAQQERCGNAEDAVLSEIKSDAIQADRSRVQDALKAAKAAGVAGIKLHAANRTLSVLSQHDRHCAALAGHFQRMVPKLQDRPWLFLQAMDKANSLGKPWTPDLEQAILAADAQMKVLEHHQSQQEELKIEMESILSDMEAAKEANQGVAAATMARLAELTEHGKALGLETPSLKKARAEIAAFEREQGRRAIAEHRLRLGLATKNVSEIQASLSDLRSLDKTYGSASEVSAKGRSSSKLPHLDKEHSELLMEAGEASARQLAAVAARRHAASTLLQQQLSEFKSGVANDENIQELKSTMREARHCGASLGLIQHAMNEVRRHRRLKQEQDRACSALREELQKNESHRNPAALRDRLRKLQRLRPLQAAADPLFPALSAR